ncbi:unnamed protein product, partial [Citrullus colocynthis]
VAPALAFRCRRRLLVATGRPTTAVGRRSLRVYLRFAPNVVAAPPSVSHVKSCWFAARLGGVIVAKTSVGLVDWSRRKWGERRA